jgi:hypothetical protein
MNKRTQINQGGAENQKKKPPHQTGSNARATDDFPTDGEEAQRRREQMQKEKAEGERRD